MRELIETRPNGTRIYFQRDEYSGSPYDDGDYMHMSAVISEGYGHHSIYESNDDEMPVTAEQVRDALRKHDYRVVARWLQVVHGLAVDGDGGGVLFFARGDLDALRDNMQIFNAWRDGECFGWIVEDPDGVDIGSVWGYYMTEGERERMLEDATDVADSWQPDPETVYRRMNRDAKLHPTGEGYPTLEVAGVLVFAYVDQQGTLQVSVDLDTADPAITSACETVPMQIAVQGERVFVGV